MQLIIAEKPSVGRDLARVLGVRGSGRNALAGTDRVITWCVGHLVELEEPAAYDGRWKAWRLDTLPMLPTAFKLRPVAGTRDQLRAVCDLLRDGRFRQVVNACDAGREGELIFRYVYELAGSRLPVQRLWVSSLTDEAIRAGFAGLRPGAAYDALGDAARCRSEADWLVGMNATRAVTVNARGSAPARPRPAPAQGKSRRGQRAHSDSPLYSIGRVQTPTLAIVVKREQEIRAFVPRDYWEVRGTFTAATSFTALWGQPADDGKTVRARLGQQAFAEAVLARAQGRGSAGDPLGPVVERLRQRRSREPAPLLFDLTSLQRTANRRFGLSATATLEAAQALYERHKILTYPRTDSRHLTDDLAAQLPKIFATLAGLPVYAPFAQPLLDQAPPRSRRVFDDGKVHDHHAIIPTGKAVRLDDLSRDEGRIFDLVVRRFLGVFHPDAEFALTDVVIRVGAAEAPGDRGAQAGEGTTPDETLVAELPPPPDRFFARGRVRLVAGWQAVAQLGEARASDGSSDGKNDGKNDGKSNRAKGRDSADTDGDGEPTLPALSEGQRLDGAFALLTKQTRPPSRHNDATLLGAMESAGREIADAELRAAMRDSGLGTPATRAATIETLIRRNFVGREAKHLVPTALGMGLIQTLPVPSLASPELTGTWEARLARVARGQETRAAFMADISRYVGEVVTAIRGGRSPQTPPAGATNGAAPARAPAPARAAAPAAATPLTCPRCREGTLVAGHRGWGCARWRQGCAFVIWFEVAGRRISDSELDDLISKGKTRRRKWPAASGAAGATMNARLVLDLNAPREAGAARLDTAS